MTAHVPALAPITLPDNEVHVWLADPAQARQAELAARYQHLLDAHERERHRSFHFDKDRHLYLAAHALARLVLSGYTQLAPEAIRFSQGPHGKPRAELPPPHGAIAYNLSHTTGLVACAVVRGRDCGVDVEARRQLQDMDNIASIIFSADERRQLAECSAHERTAHFFTLWTLKEAYAKATGRGIGADLTAVSFEIAAGPPVCQPAPDDAHDTWFFHCATAGSGHALAVAVRSPAPSTTVLMKQFML